MLNNDLTQFYSWKDRLLTESSKQPGHVKTIIEPFEEQEQDKSKRENESKFLIISIFETPEQKELWKVSETFKLLQKEAQSLQKSVVDPKSIEAKQAKSRDFPPSHRVVLMVFTAMYPTTLFIKKTVVPQLMTIYPGLPDYLLHYIFLGFSITCGTYFIIPLSHRVANKLGFLDPKLPRTILTNILLGIFGIHVLGLTGLSYLQDQESIISMLDPTQLYLSIREPNLIMLNYE